MFEKQSKPMNELSNVVQFRVAPSGEPPPDPMPLATFQSPYMPPTDVCLPLLALVQVPIGVSDRQLQGSEIWLGGAAHSNTSASAGSRSHSIARCNRLRSIPPLTPRPALVPGITTDNA